MTGFTTTPPSGTVDSALNIWDFGGRPGGADVTPAFNRAIQAALTRGLRKLKFPGAGRATGNSNYVFLTTPAPIPAMPPVHNIPAAGPMEPFQIEGDGYGNTQLTGANITTYTPIIGRGLQFRSNLIVEGPVHGEGAGNVDYPHRFSDCGFTDAGIFFKVDCRVIMDMCNFVINGNGPLLSHLAPAGRKLWIHLANCECDASYIVSGPIAYTIKELTVVGGTAGGSVYPFLGLYDAQATPESIRVLGNANIPDSATPDLSTMGRPTGSLAETYPRLGSPLVRAGATLVAGRLHLVGIGLAAGLVVTNISFMSGDTAANLPTNWWFALYDRNLNLLGQSADQGAAAWAADTVKTLALGAPVTLASTGLYYLGIMVAGTGAPTLVTVPGTANTAGVAPVLNGFSTAGLAGVAPNPAAALTATANTPWAYVG